MLPHVTTEHLVCLLPGPVTIYGKPEVIVLLGVSDPMNKKYLVKVTLVRTLHATATPIQHVMDQRRNMSQSPLATHQRRNSTRDTCTVKLKASPDDDPVDDAVVCPSVTEVLDQAVVIVAHLHEDRLTHQ
jgi:hypothetical protein